MTIATYHTLVSAHTYNTFFLIKLKKLSLLIQTHIATLHPFTE